MDLTLRTVDTIHALERSAADELTAGGSIFVGRPHIAATEGDAGLTRNHLVVEGSGGSLLGMLPTYLSLNPGSWEWDHFVRYVARDDGPEGREGWHPILLGCPSPGYPNSLIVHPDLEERDRTSVVAALIRGFGELAGRLGARSASLMYLDAGSVADLAPFLGDGDAVLWSGADAAIRVQWPSFEAYLSWLPRKRRKEARREMKKFGAAGFDVSAEGLKDCYEEIAPLAGNLKRRHGSDLDDAHWARSFGRYAAELDDASTAYVCREGGDAVAFSLFSEWGDTVYVRACGFDYGRAGSNAEYFNLCYYLPLRHAIDRGASRLHLGLDAYEAKVSRGAKLDPLWSVVLGPKEPTSDWKRPLASFNRGRLDRYEAAFGPRAVGDLWSDGSRPRAWEPTAEAGSARGDG